MKIGDTNGAFKAILVLEQLVQVTDSTSSKLKTAELAVGAKIRVFDFNKKEYEIMPVYYVENGIEKTIEDSIPSLGLKVALWHINPDEQKVDISFSEKKSNQQDFIVMNAVIFPGINILWTGCLIMIIGTLIAIRQRFKKA